MSGANQHVVQRYQNTLLREMRAYDGYRHGRSAEAIRSRREWGRLRDQAEDLRRELSQAQQRAVYDDVIDMFHGGDVPRDVVASHVRVLDPADANANNARQVRNANRNLLEENDGKRIAMDLRPFDPERGARQTRSVVVTIKGYYEVIQGNTTVVSDPDHVKEHVFVIRNFSDMRELKKGAKMAMNKLLENIEMLDGDSGYKAFYPMTYHVSDAYTNEELALFVRTPTTIRLHAHLPVQFGFLKRMGVDVDNIPTSKEENAYENCLLSTILKHMRDNKIMVREKWTAERIAAIMIDGDVEGIDVHRRGYSVSEAQRFFDYIEQYNVYSFDQLGNILWKSEYKKSDGGGKMRKPALLFISHNAHCYQITDAKVIYSVLQRIRAMGNGKTNMFQCDKDAERDAKAGSVVQLLKRQRFRFKWTSGDVNLTKLNDYQNCNLFVDASDLKAMHLQLFRQTNYVHTTEVSVGRIVRINYHDDVTIWANSNKKVVNKDLNVIGSSAMSRVVCQRFGVPWKNQSIGASTGAFCDLYFNPLSGKNGGRSPMTKEDRKRHFKRFDGICQCCKKKVTKADEFEIDHIIRREVGGTDEDANLQLLHKKCHDAKTNMECNVFRLDRTLSHYNSATIEVFKQVKNAMVHNFVDFDEYAEIIASRTADTKQVVKKLKVKKGVILAGLDIVKCRTYILRYGMNSEKWADFSALDDVQVFDMTNQWHASIPPGEYEIHTNRMCPSKGNEWCSHVKVKFMLAKKLLTLDQIKHAVFASMYHPGDYYEKFVQAVLDKMITHEPGTKEWKQEWHVAKNCINQWVGTLGIRTSDYKNSVIYTSLEAAATDAKERQVGTSSSGEIRNRSLLAGETVRVFPKRFQNTYTADEADDEEDNKGKDEIDYIEMVTKSSKVRWESHVPIYRTILDAEVCELYKIMEILRKFGGRVVNVNTDNAVAMFDSQEQVDAMQAYADTIFWDPERKINKYKRGDVPSVNVVERMEKLSKDVFVYEKPEYLIIPDPGHNDAKAMAKDIVKDLLNPNIDGSLQIEGMAGTGKTTLTNCIIDELRAEKIPFLAVAPTHVASRLLGKGETKVALKDGGQTLDAALASCKHGNFRSLSGYKVVIVDEKSMVKSDFWAALAMWKRVTGNTLRCVVVGCWRQLGVVRDRCDNFNYQDASIVHELCAGKMMELTKCRRAASDKGGRELFKQYKDVSKMDVTKFGKKEQVFSIAYYNATVHELNEKWMHHFKKGKEHITVKADKSFKNVRKCQDIIVFEGLPVMACITRASLNLYNSEQWVVHSFNKKNVTLVSPDDDTEFIDIAIADFANFLRPAYSVTCHKMQGRTLRHAYSIYNWPKMCQRMRYVALSRGTTIDHVHIMDRESPAEEAKKQAAFSEAPNAETQTNGDVEITQVQAKKIAYAFEKWATKFRKRIKSENPEQLPRFEADKLIDSDKQALHGIKDDIKQERKRLADTNLFIILYHHIKHLLGEIKELINHDAAIVSSYEQFVLGTSPKADSKVEITDD